MTRCIAAILLALAAVIPPAAAQSFNFTTIDAPGATTTFTYGQGINAEGTVAGYYTVDPNGVLPATHGFIDLGGIFQSIDDPLATSGTWVYGINNAGVLTGYYVGSGGIRGFVDIAGVFTDVVDPLATTGTFPQSINDAGAIAGYYIDGSGSHSFTDVGGVFTTIADPAAWPGSTNAYGINDADIVSGNYAVDPYANTQVHGFVDAAGAVSDVDDPAAPAASSQVFGINNAGDLAGAYTDGQQVFGFVDQAGTFLAVDDPASPREQTIAYAVSDTGQVTGIFRNAQGGTSAFLATPQAETDVPEPASALLFGAALACLVATRYVLRPTPRPVLRLPVIRNFVVSAA